MRPRMPSRVAGVALAFAAWFLIAGRMAWPHAWALLTVFRVSGHAKHGTGASICMPASTCRPTTWTGWSVLPATVVRLFWSTVHLPEQGRLMSADLAHVVAFGLGRLSSD